jgi:iron complex outermembrane receptor protein
MGISAFSDISLEDAGISNTGELLRFAPNVYLRKDANQNFIVIRGVTNFYGAKLSPVGFYVDDVSFPLNGMHDVDLMDIERIEILKGPQGTLYGMNSEAGVVNIITRRPGNEVKGKIFGEYSWYDTEHGNSPGYKLGGTISGPIVKDNLYLGLAGQWKDYQGVMKNEFNGDDGAGEMEELNCRAHLRWTPGYRWNISFITDLNDFYGGMSDYRYITGPSNEGRHRVSYDDSFNDWNQNGDGQTLKVGYEGDGFNLLSVTSRRYYKNDSASDLDCTSFDSPWAGDGFFKDEDTTYSQEMRLSSPDDNGPLEWLTGVFLFDEETDVLVQRDLSMQDIRDNTVDSSGYAIFGQGTYTVMDRLHLTAGVRFDHVDLDGQQTYTAMGTTNTYGRDLSDDEILPKFSAAWDFTDDIMAYATIAKGYLYGGYNYSKGTGLDNLTYDPEYTWNYEVGAKSAWFDNRLTANLAAFYIEMKDKQVAEWSDDLGNPVQEIKNAADAHSIGVELELQAKPVQGLDLFANFGLTKSRIDDWVATEYSMATSNYYQYDYKDNKLPNVPEYTYNFGVQYRHSTGFFGRADLLGTGEFYSDSKNTAIEKAYQLVNLRAGYEGENYDIIFWCKNVFDEEYQKVRFAVGADQMGIDGEPRMVGMTVAYRF